MFEERTDGSDMVFDFFCEFCKDDGLNLEAEGYCVDCREYLCLTCFTHHRRNRASRHHDLLDKDRMPKGTPLVYEEKVNKDISTKCKQHNGATVKYYCRSHGVLGCSDCFVSDHGSCSNIVNIHEEADAVFESQEYKDFMQFMKSLEKRSTNILKSARLSESNVKSYSSDTIKDVRHYAEGIIRTLDELERGLKTKSETIKSEDENTLKMVSDICQAAFKSSEEIITEFDHLKTSKRVCQAYIRMIEAKPQTMELEKSLCQAEKQNIRVQWFDPNSKLKETLTNESKLGCISVQYSSFTASVESPSYNSAKVRAKCVGEIDVRSNRDINDSCIFGSAVVSSNRLIVTDNENLKVKLLDTNANKLLSELTVTDWPWDVAAISRSLVAVTLHCGRKILLLRVSNKLILEKEIAVHGECKGVAYTKDRLVVTYINPPKLEIMDLAGSVLKKIDKDSHGKQLFRCPLYSCVSNDGEIIYVSDAHYESEGVTSLTIDGVVKSVYTGSKLKGPQKICVDQHDNVYVCRNSSENVHMLSPDLIKIQIILTKKDGLDNDVRSLSHCQETNRLFVGVWDKVKVFQLSQ